MKPRTEDKPVEVVCLGHQVPLIDRCKGCEHDYDTSHHPNNFDCDYFTQQQVHYFEVKE